MKSRARVGWAVFATVIATALTVSVIAYTWLSSPLQKDQALGAAKTAQTGSVQPDAAAKAAANDGTLTPLGGRPTPNFTLVDQYGRPVSLSQFRGKAVVLTPMDSVCTTICPVLAGEMLQADRALGSLANKTVFVAFNIDPYFSQVKYVQAFDRAHGLTGMKNWYFATGTPAQMQSVANKYAIWVQLLPKQRAVNHASYMYFISPSGEEEWLSGASGNSRLAVSYVALIKQYVKQMVKA